MGSFPRVQPLKVLTHTFALEPLRKRHPLPTLRIFHNGLATPSEFSSLLLLPPPLFPPFSPRIPRQSLPGDLATRPKTTPSLRIGVKPPLSHFQHLLPASPRSGELPLTSRSPSLPPVHDFLLSLELEVLAKSFFHARTRRAVKMYIFPRGEGERGRASFSAAKSLNGAAG